jgi:hypothetical protein
MGFSSDIMHDLVAKEIRSIYSSYDGWKYTFHPTGKGYDRIVTLERRNDGHRECVKVLVTLEKSVPSPLPEEIVRPDRAADGTVTRYTYAVMVPAHADTSSVPAGVRVLIMNSFAFENKELIWVKKPVRKSEGAPVKSTA